MGAGKVPAGYETMDDHFSSPPPPQNYQQVPPQVCQSGIEQDAAVSTPTSVFPVSPSHCEGLQDPGASDTSEDGSVSIGEGEGLTCLMF